MFDALAKIQIGDEARIRKKVTAEDVLSFAEISGDRNPLHLDEEFAATSIYMRRIAHGMMSASMFSGIFGSELPGPGSLYISQSLKFPSPVFVGDVVEAVVRVEKLKRRFRWVYFNTVCVDLTTGKTVIEGDAVIYVLPPK